MSETDQTQPTRTETMSDEQFFEARRETMGDQYPGDEAMRAFDREADAEWQAQVQRDAAAPAAEPAAAEPAAAEPAAAEPAAAEPAAAEAPATPAAQAETAAPREWNAREWLNETFKDDPAFKDLTADEMTRLEALANEKHEEFAGEVQEWAQEKSAEWGQELQAGVQEGLNTNPELARFAEERLADGDMSAEDKAALEGIAKDITPQEGAAVIRPIAEALHEVHGELIDGVEMIVDHAVEDVHDVVEARAEMTGGDSPQVQTLLHQLEEAPDQVHDALDWEREQAEAQWGKFDERLDLIEAGTDPKDLPPDTDTYQVDDHADQYETAEA